MGLFGVLEESLERGCKTICGRGCVPCPAPDTLAPGDRFAPQYFYWNPLWRPPDGEEFIVSREQETKFDKEKVTSLGTPSFRAHWK